MYRLSVLFVSALLLGLASPSLADDEVRHPDVVAKYPWVRGLQPGGRPPDEVPMYGGIDRSEEAIGQDEAFLARVRDMGFSRTQGAYTSIEIGFRYLRKGDVPTAMKRFNQAWLLDPSVGDVYHGFAVATAERDGDMKTAERFFRIATRMDNTGPRAFADYGRLLLIQERHADAVPVLRTAVRKAPDLVPAQAWLGHALYKTGKVGEACGLARENIEVARGPAQRLLSEILQAPGCTS